MELNIDAEEMKKILLIIGLAACLSACVESPDMDSSELIGIVAKLPDLDLLTKSTFQIDAEGVHVFWAEGDTIGIIPSIGDQAFFPIESGAGTNVANFNGGGWGLKDDKTYSAYYPFSSHYYSLPHNAIHLTYEGQSQEGNNNGDHLGRFDYLASGADYPVDQYLALHFVRLGSIVCFRLTVPKPGIYTSAIIVSDADWVIEVDLDITGAVPVTVPKRTANQMRLSLSNIETTSANEAVTLYMMSYPIDLTGHSLRIILYGEGVSCSAELTPKNMVAGKPYMFTAESMETGIDFADEVVRNVCLANWDANGNGLLEQEEAASVHSIGTLFRGKTIASFDELQFFTSITTIEDYAFEGCSMLESIVLPPALSGTLGSNAFRGCRSLNSLVIPEGITRIEDDAFNDCQSLSTLVLPSGLVYAGSGAFSGTALVSITLPDQVEAGPYRLFASCASLESVTIPSTWTFLGDDYFYGCTSLQNITIPEGIKRIGGRCFCGCSSLGSISLPSSLLILDDNAFNGCSALESITIPEGVKAILEGTFAGCSQLSHVSLPEGLVSIGEYGNYWQNGAFSCCTSLEELTLPNSLSYIGAYSFFETAIKQIVIPDGVTLIAKGAFEWSSLEEIILPAGLKMIDEGVFTYTNLTSLRIPESVAMIKPNLLPNTITSIRLDSTVPPSLVNLSTIPDNDCPIYVPSISVVAYKEAPLWSNYASRIQAITDSGGENPDPGGWRNQ